MGKYSGILICSDYDETLAVRSRVSNENKEALKYFCENGGAFTVISGRRLGFIREYASDIGINAPFAGLNGSYIWDFETGETLHCTELDRSTLYPCLEYMKAHEKMAHMVLFSNENTVKIIKKDGGFSVTSHDSRDDEIEHEFFSSVSINEEATESNSRILDSFLKGRIYKFVVGIPKKEGDEDFLIPEKKILTELTHNKLAASRAWPYAIEFQSKEATKGKAVKFIKEYVKADVSIGIGNYENDLTMVEDADIGVAVANSCPELLAAADRVVKDYREHALRDLIENLDTII